MSDVSSLVGVANAASCRQRSLANGSYHFPLTDGPDKVTDFLLLSEVVSILPPFEVCGRMAGFGNLRGLQKFTTAFQPYKDVSTA